MSYLLLELEELEELKNKYVLRRTKSLIASQLPCKGMTVRMCHDVHYTD